MKKRININKDDVYLKLNRIPYFIVYLLILFLPPIGIYILVVKMSKDKIQLYKKSRYLTGLGIFILFLLGIGIYSKVKEIVVLYDSGMSLDMINFIPNDIYLYIIGTIMCISYFIGGKKLMDQAKIEKVYTKSINLEHETSIKKISEKLNVSIEEVKDNIKLLQKYNYLIPLEIGDKKNKIIYKDKENNKVISIKKKNNKTVKCHKCGAIVPLKLNEYVECDFCGNGLIDEDNN